MTPVQEESCFPNIIISVSAIIGLPFSRRIIYFPDENGNWSGRLSESGQNGQETESGRRYQSHGLVEATEEFRRKYGDIPWNFHPHNDLNSGFDKRFQGDVWVLTAAQLLKVRRLGLIERLPRVKENDILDRDKASGLGKPTSQLEIMALAFIVTALCTYVLWFGHPQDVMCAYYLPAKRLPTRLDVSEISSGSFSISYLELGNNTVAESSRGHTMFWSEVYLTGIAAIVFGSIHFLAWNSVFPTQAERLLWSISAFITALGPLVYTLELQVLAKICLGRHNVPKFVKIFLAAFSVYMVYGLARLFLVVEA
ncbi:hypothetical protein AJ79_05053 [Helicocarpus griseus UAMH5409]|uniref:Uncharacterized protein n=1 Tax=Helicocarpus griseus UAMH5409 TaxID=1447875 RepID=A0A2B7XR73_9EURO|nr:hypothetical protein AJ79_05053 [Helicocarpus griseus UAMH5409]